MPHLLMLPASYVYPWIRQHTSHARVSGTIALILNHNHDVVIRGQVPLYPVGSPFVAALVEDVLSEIGELVARHLEIVGALIAPLDGARVDAINGTAVLAIASPMIAALDIVSEAAEIGNTVHDVVLLCLIEVVIEAAEDFLQGHLARYKVSNQRGERHVRRA